MSYLEGCGEKLLEERDDLAAISTSLRSSNHYVSVKTTHRDIAAFTPIDRRRVTHITEMTFEEINASLLEESKHSDNPFYEKYEPKEILGR